MNNDEFHAKVLGLIEEYVSTPPSGVTHPGISRIKFPSLLDEMLEFAEKEAQTYLTKEQIANEGWEPWKGENGVTPLDLALWWGAYRFEKENYILIFGRRDHTISITRKRGESIFTGLTNIQIFEGTCESVNELRLLHKLLKIK